MTSKIYAAIIGFCIAHSHKRDVDDDDEPEQANGMGQE